MDGIPAPPGGYVLDDDIPPPPDGFELDDSFRATARKRLAVLGGRPESEKADFAPEPVIPRNSTAIQPVIREEPVAPARRGPSFADAIMTPELQRAAGRIGAPAMEAPEITAATQGIRDRRAAGAQRREKYLAPLAAVGSEMFGGAGEMAPDATPVRRGVPLFAGKAIGEAPVTRRAPGVGDVALGAIASSPPVERLKSDYERVHGWAQGASDDLGKWATKNTEHSSLARLIDAGEQSDSKIVQTAAAITQGAAQAGASSLPALAEFGLLHRATPGAMKPLVDAALVSYFGGEGVGGLAQDVPAIASEMNSETPPLSFDERANLYGKTVMDALMGAAPFGARRHIADSLEARRAPLEVGEPGARVYQPEYGEAGPPVFRAPEDVMAKARGLISPLIEPRLGEYRPDLAPPPARGNGAYARDIVPPEPGPKQVSPEEAQAVLDRLLGGQVEGQRMGPFPVPPDISQGRTLPPGPALPEGATWQERQAAARRQPSPAPPPEPPPSRPRYAPPEVPPDATWQQAQATERAKPANPLEDPEKLREILSNLLGPEPPQGVEARTGRTPPAAENIQPEPKATLDAQMQALVEGRKPAVLFPRQGEHAVPVTPDGFVRVDTPAGAVIFDPNKVDAGAVAKAADSGQGLGKILGMGVDERPEGAQTVVTARTPEGVEVQSAQATPEQVPAAVEAAQKVAGPEGRVTQGSTADIVAERQAGMESEKADVAPQVAKAIYGPDALPGSVEFVRRVLGGDVPPKAAPKVVARIRLEAKKAAKAAPPVERRVEDKGPEGRIHFVDVGQIASDYKLRELRKLNEAMDSADEARRISEREAIDAVSRARAAEILAPEHAEFAARRETRGLPGGGEGARGPAAEGERLPGSVADAVTAGPAEAAGTSKSQLPPAAEPVAGATPVSWAEAKEIRSTQEMIRITAEVEPATAERLLRRVADSPTQPEAAKAWARRQLALDPAQRFRPEGKSGPTSGVGVVQEGDKTWLDMRGRPEEKSPVPGPPSGAPAAGAGAASSRRRSTIWVKPDQPIEVEHQIVEAGDVVPSHDAEGRIDPRYPQKEGLQPRDRSRDESIRQITAMSRNLNPDLLGESLDATTGAPVVTDAADGGLHPVESGNGRAAAIREAYRTGRAGAYRERLEADAARYGMTPEQVAAMREPMLVRSRVTEMTPEEQRQFTRDANASSALRMGAAEQATSDAAALTPEILADFLPSEEGDVLAASNRRFLRRFFDEVVPETDRGELIDADGNPNLRAVQRIKAAIMGKAYGQDRLLARALEAADDNTRTVSNGLLSAAPRVAKVRAAIEAGDLHPVDFLAPIKEAVDHLYSAKDMKLSVPDYLAQRDMFAGEMSPEGSALLSFMDKNKRSAKKIGGMVDAIARAVEGAGHPGQADLFGGEVDVPRVAEIYDAAKRIYEARHEETTSAQTGLFDQAGGGGPDRGEGPGAGPAGGGGAGGDGAPRVFAYSSGTGRGVGRDPYAERTGRQKVPVPSFKRLPRTPAVPPPDGPLEPERYDSPSGAPRQATMAGPGEKAETNPREIVKALEDVSGTPIRYGHGYFGPRRALGWFDPRNNAIRTKVAEDMVTAAHEAGHSLHQFALKDRQAFPAAVAIELTRLGKDLYGSRMPAGGYLREGMAEYVGKYLIGDDMAKEAPALHKWVRDNMPPEKLGGLDSARELYRKWDEAGAVGRVKGKIHTVESGPVAQLKDGIEKLTHFFSRQMWVNKFAPLEDAVGRVMKEHGLVLEPTKNPAFVAAALEKNAPGTARTFIFNAAVNTKGDVVGGSLADALKEIPHKELPDLMAYSYARRAEDLWERGINPGITLADAQATVKQLESPQRRAALDAMTKWSNYLIDYVVESGGLTAAEAKVIRAANPVYVPLKRYFDEVERGGGGGARAGFVNQGKGVQKIRGSGRSVINPLDSFIRQADSMVRLGNKLRVGRSIADMVTENPGLAWFAQKVESPKESTEFSVRELKRQLEKAGADLSAADLDATLTVFQNAGEYRGRQNIVSIARNGQREFWELDPDVYRVVTHMDHEVLPSYLSALAAPKRLVQLGATGVNAGFSLIANPIRDAFTWAVYSKGRHLTPADALVGLWSGLSKSPEAQRWRALGGELSTLMGQDRIAAGRAVEEALARTGKEKAWITLRHPIDALREHLGVFESGPRIAEFTRVLEQAEQKWGKGTENAYLEALLASKEATVNFTRAGVIGQALNQLIPFFNAKIQGASKFYRTFGGSEGKAAALKATAQAVSWITVPTALLWYANKDEEWYKELKSWEKGAFWVWSTDHGKTKYRIPKPQELGYIFGSVPEAFLDYAYRKNGRGVSDAMWGTLDSLMPFGLSQGAAGVADVLPAAIKPMIEAGLNYDTFKNRPIVDPFMERRKLPRDQYQRYTTEIAKQLGAWLNISPSKIDHTVSGYTGGLGLDLARGVELATGMRKMKDIEGLEDVPVLGRLGVRATPGVSVDHMHEQDALLRQKVGSKVATEEEKATLKRIAAAKTAIDHARIAAEGAKGDDLHTLNTWSTHMAQWALGKRAEMPEEELESLEEKFPSEEWGKAFKAMRRKIPTYEAEAPPE